MKNKLELIKVENFLKNMKFKLVACCIDIDYFTNNGGLDIVGGRVFFSHIAGVYQSIRGEVQNC